MTRENPFVLLRAAQANASANPCPDHHRLAFPLLNHVVLSAGEQWFVSAVLRLPSINPVQRARLLELQSKVERRRA